MTGVLLVKSQILDARHRRATVCLLVGLSFFLLPAAMQGQSLFFTPPTYCAQFEADFNGDGKPDLLCEGMVLLGNGDGTFTTGASISGTALAIADFNGDGKPDILEQGTGTLLVLLGNGDGTFQPAISTPSGASLTTVVAGDLNGDGKADVVGIFNNNLLVYVSNSDGTFAAGVSYSLGSSTILTETMLLGDFNGDGKLDVAVITAGDNAAGQIIVFPGKGDGTLQSAVTSSGVYGSAQSPIYAVAGDFNGDGKLDLALTASPICTPSTCVGTNNVSILLGTGDGTFQGPAVAFSGEGPLATADFNGDGKLDLAFGNGPLIQIYLGNGDGTFLATKSYHCSPGVFGSATVIVADFNQDGKPDIAAGGFVLLGNGDGTFQGWPAVIVPGNFIGIATGDFDKNGTQDVAEILSNTVGSTTTYSVNILLSDSTGTPNLAHTYSIQQSPAFIATADLNGDGDLDLVITGTDPATQVWGYTVLLGNGNGSFQAPVSYLQNAVTSVGQIIIADFNNDHKPDIAITLGNQNVEVLLGNGDGTFGTSTGYFDNGGGPLVSADFNGDGNLDLAVSAGSGSGAQTAILYGKGDGTFQPAIFPLGEFAVLFTGDFNNDGKADLLGQGEIGPLLLGNGDGTFTASNRFTVLPNSSAGPYFDVVADFNGDGNLDVVGFFDFGVHDKTEGVYLGNGDGTFNPFVTVVALNALDIEPPLVVAVADFNGDSKPDLLISGNDVANGSIDLYVLINATTASQSAGAKLSASSLTFPSTATGSSSSTMSVTVTNTGKGALSVSGIAIAGAQASQFSQSNNCTTVQSAASCTINAVFSPTVAGNAAASLTITDNTVSGAQTVALSGVATAPPSFSVGSGSGSPTSQTISAGQSAKFSLAITPSGGFTGTVGLSCAVSPVKTAGPMCSLSSSSLQISGGAATPLTVTVGTTATTTTGTVSNGEFPPGAWPMMWTAMLLGSGWLLRRHRKRLPSLAAPLIVLALASGMGCGGNSPTKTTTTTGTPSGTYTATVTATSGTVSQTMSLTVIVQ